MIWRALLSLLLVSALLLPETASAQSLAGTYVYESPDGPVALTLQEQGATLVGQMTGADGSVFHLEGTIESGHATGMIRIGEGIGWFAVGLVGEGLKLVVAELDPATGQPDLSQSWNLDFARSGIAAQPGPPAGAPVAEQGWPPARSLPPGQPGAGSVQPEESRAGAAEAGIEHDPTLVGLWSHSDTYQSGDFFATTRLSMQVNADGTYLYGAGDVSLGGAYIGRSGGGDVTRGRWRTQDGVVFVMEDGGFQWAAHARYYVDGNSLMFTFANGKRQLWQRQR